MPLPGGAEVEPPLGPGKVGRAPLRGGCYLLGFSFLLRIRVPWGQGWLPPLPSSSVLSSPENLSPSRPPALSILLTYTRVPRSTKLLVARVQSRLQKVHYISGWGAPHFLLLAQE